MLRALVTGLLLLWATACAARGDAEAKWPDWQAFSQAFIDEQGRVIDWTADGRTVSEGQAYALFFALAANDRARFSKILGWTERNLARGNLSLHLPAWHWGRRQDGTWGVVDANAASDADLWIAYALLEAGRLWKVPRYRDAGRALLTNVRNLEVVTFEPRSLLLPGPIGFVEGTRVRFNPSYYVPVQLLRFHAEFPEAGWLQLLEDYVALLTEAAPLGRVPDWAQWTGEKVAVDAQTHGVGSYDAIRVYLWAAYGPATHPQVAALRATLKPFASMIRELERVPERWSVGNSGISGDAPPGFHAALLPFLKQTGHTEEARRSELALMSVYADGLYGRPARYYDHVLILFGKGYAEGRFRFDAQGRLVPTWMR